MRGRDIVEVSAIGALLIAAMCTVGMLVVLALSGCQSGPVPPGPVPPSPQPVPTGTACERACARADQLGCDSGGPDCVDACERAEQLGGAFARNPELQAKAGSCQELESVRAGGEP